MGLKKNRRNAKILPNQTFFVLMTSHTPPPNTSSIVPSCGLHARVARHAKVHLIFRTCRKNYFTLFRKKKQTHFASEELLKQPLCAVFFYALILFPTLSWLISIPRQIPYIKRFCINQEPIVQVLTHQTEDSSPRALDLLSSPRKETWVEFDYFKKILSSSSVVNDDCLRHFSS